MHGLTVDRHEIPCGGLGRKPWGCLSIRASAAYAVGPRPQTLGLFEGSRGCRQGQGDVQILRMRVVLRRTFSLYLAHRDDIGSFGHSPKLTFIQGAPHDDPDRYEPNAVGSKDLVQASNLGFSASGSGFGARDSGLEA